jgi:hypothetical protein
MSARALQRLVKTFKVSADALRTKTKIKSDESGVMKAQDGFIDIDLDDSSTSLYAVAIVAYLVGESGNDVGFKSSREQDLEVYTVDFKELDEYKRMVISACLEGDICDRELESVKFRIKKRYTRS